MLISCNGTQLWVQSYERNGDPVIFLHFSNGQAGMWGGVIPHFVHDYWPIAIDMRGHGRSAKPETGNSISEMARDIIGVMDYLGIDRARVVGSSMGAEIALRMAAEYPERVAAVVLEQAFQNSFGPHGVYDVPDAAIPAKLTEIFAQRAERPRFVADSLEEALSEVIGRWGVPDTPQVRDALRGSLGPGPDGRFGYRVLPAAADEYLRDYLLTRFERDFERVSCPVLFLPDERSMQDPRVQASMDWFRGLLKEVATTVIPGAEHAAMAITHPQEVAQAVRQFFSTGK